MENNKFLNHQYNNAAEIIKTAILQTQYEASKDINRIQLGLYFGIGKFLSEKTRNAKWGTEALQTISNRLKSDLPGLRGFSATSLKKMRIFYDNWKSIIYNSSVATDEFNDNNALVVFELKTGDFKSIYLAQLMTYLRILDDKVRKSHENPSIGIVLCRNANKDFVKYVIQDYDKPMGVATFDTLSEMPEKLQKALPDIKELKKLL